MLKENFNLVIIRMLMEMENVREETTVSAAEKEYEERRRMLEELKYQREKEKEEKERAELDGHGQLEELMVLLQAVDDCLQEIKNSPLWDRKMQELYESCERESSPWD